MDKKEYEFEEFTLSDLQQIDNFFKESNIKPIYDSRSDFTTNAPSFYEYLAKHNHLIRILAHRIYDYDKILYDKLMKVERTLKEYSDILDNKINDFDNIILNKTEKWLSENMKGILTQAIKIVWFGLTDDGYFMAVIPENWDSINFDTTENGELILINGGSF